MALRFTGTKDPYSRSAPTGELASLAALGAPSGHGAARAGSGGPEAGRGGRRGTFLSVLTIGTVVAVLAAAAVFAAVPKTAGAVLHGVSAWLSDQRTGSVVQVDGLTGKADARVPVSAAGHRVRVIQDGTEILVQDLATGQVSRIDPSQLSVSASGTVSAAGTRVLAGGGAAYLVDPVAAAVQGLDPATLTLTGPAVGPPQLTAPLGDTGAESVGPDGTLWVADRGSGTLIPVKGGAAGTPERIGSPGDPLLVSVTAAGPVVTDVATAVMHLPATNGPGRTVTLPSALSSGGSVLEPPATAGSLVPVLVTPANQLVVVDTARGAADTVTITAAAGDAVDTPLVLGSRVYLPDETRGALLVYDYAAGKQVADVAIGSGPGPIDAFVQDGEVWANTPGGGRAVCVGADGSVHDVDKDPGGLPGGPTSPSASPSATSDASAPTGGAGPGPGPTSSPAQGSTSNPAGPPSTPPVSPRTSSSTAPTTPRPTPPKPSATPTAPTPPPPSTSPHTTSPPPTTPSSTPLPPPTAPGSVTEHAGAGFITVTFNPVATANVPISYQLTGAPAGASLTPAGGVPGSGPNYTFTVSGLNCGTPYTFGVSAVFANGSATTRATSAALACRAPGAVSSLKAVKSDHQIALSWNAAAANGGAVTYSVAWSGGTPVTVSGTGYTISGLTIDRTYDVSVTPSNGAGQGGAATATVDLSNNVDYALYNAPALHLQFRTGPSTDDSVITQFPLTPPGGPGATVTVLCQVRGGVATDPADSSLTGDIWDKAVYQGNTGYVSDLYVETPSSEAKRYNSFSSNLWQC